MNPKTLEALKASIAKLKAIIRVGSGDLLGIGNNL